MICAERTLTSCGTIKQLQIIPSLVFVVLVLFHVEEVLDSEYTLHWLLYVELRKKTVQAFDSFATRGGSVSTHFATDLRVLGFSFSRNSHRPKSNHEIPNGVRCFWSLCKDLIFLTAFRNPRVLRRGKEKASPSGSLKWVRTISTSGTSARESRIYVSV